MIDTSSLVLVTGASGFAGRHIVEQLSNHSYQVRALIRRVPRREFGRSVEVAIGDLSQPETYAPALQGVSAVVHAALTDDLSQEPQATSTLLSLSARAGIHKFVHLSSVAVYGNPSSGIVTEETAPIPSADTYSRTKLAIEEALRVNSKNLQIVVLRLGCVYGPGGGWWTEGLLNQMRMGKLILVNRGTGIANLIHVADVGAMVARVLALSNASFDVFNATDGTPVAWSAYFAELEKIAGRNATIAMSVAEAREHARKWLHPSFTRRVIRKISGAPVIYPLDDRGIENFASCAIYSSQKATRVLDFQPEYDLESGMRTVQSIPENPQTSAVGAYQS
jgi:nucleoside-diphosphate-sugar epimerase